MRVVSHPYLCMCLCECQLYVASTIHDADVCIYLMTLQCNIRLTCTSQQSYSMQLRSMQCSAVQLQYHRASCGKFALFICLRMHSIVQHSIAQYSIAQYSIVQHSIAQHSIAQHSIAQHSIAQYSIAQHSIAQHSIALHSIVLHSIVLHSIACMYNVSLHCV